MIMTKEEQTIWFNHNLADAKMNNSFEELAIGWMRYKALRVLTPQQYFMLHARNMAGERFDDMVDELVADLGR
jgi:hypothetical protein